MIQYQQAKSVVLDFYREFDRALISQQPEEIVAALHQYTAADYHWRGLHPFHEIAGVEAVAEQFWQPFVNAFTSVQRRNDIFLAGSNDAGSVDAKAKNEDSAADDGQADWICSMGHFVALFDSPWLGIPPTGKMVYFRFAEFHCVEDNKITRTALFFDLLSIMKQAGHYPLPPETGVSMMYPGPKTHDGLLLEAQPESEGQETLALINRMVADLSELNKSADDHCPPELLARTWHDDMLWYGPTGIGATLSIERYQKQHQYPFRENLADKVFNGHVCRIAEGSYGAFFGWPNLSNRPTGGFLGLPGSQTPADMRVVDVYRRDGDKLAENWIFIDIPHYLNQQGLDVLQRMEKMLVT